MNGVVDIFKKLVCALVACCTFLFLAVIECHAVDGPNSLDFAEQGIMAHRDGWHYYYGGKGEVRDGVRVSDCAGLLYSYFQDIGVGGCMGGCTAQVTYNCIMSSRLSGAIPRIHGLAVTMYDTVDPDSGLYGHIGIYIGGGEVCDNSTYGTNMVRKGVFERDWTEWHLFDNGLRYPVDGWYEFDGRYVHYTNYEYDVDTTFDGYHLDSKGFADNVDVELSDRWATAGDVKEYLLSQGWPDDGGVCVDFEPNGKVTGVGVNLRQGPTTNSARMATLTKGQDVEVISSEKGQSVDGEDIWYYVKLRNGQYGYVLRTYVAFEGSVPKPPDPTLSIIGDSVVLECEGNDVYYTMDCSDPVSNGTLCTGPLYNLGRTYRFVGHNESGYSNVVTKSVCSNGAVFDDFVFTDWFADKLDKGVCSGLFSGTGNGKFSPKANMTRGQFVLVLARYVGVDLDRYEGWSNFVDVGTNRYYTAAVNWANEQGIVSGIGHNEFAPESPITREQMCTILARYLDLDIGVHDPFDDDSRISSWAKPCVYACRSNGIVSGIGGNRFDPKGILSRAQGVTVFVNLD
ncbi:MAG: SH3 domain-containing protein [Clostridia bacterium]|nr:SH3 domain-containing protein [Clostridia bacterium]